MTIEILNKVKEFCDETGLRLGEFHDNIFLCNVNHMRGDLLTPPHVRAFARRSEKKTNRVIPSKTAKKLFKEVEEKWRFTPSFVIITSDGIEIYVKSVKKHFLTQTEDNAIQLYGMDGEKTSPIMTVYSGKDFYFDLVKVDGRLYVCKSIDRYGTPHIIDVNPAMTWEDFKKYVDGLD